MRLTQLLIFFIILCLIQCLLGFSSSNNDLENKAATEHCYYTPRECTKVGLVCIDNQKVCEKSVRASTPKCISYEKKPVCVENTTQEVKFCLRENENGCAKYENEEKRVCAEEKDVCVKYEEKTEQVCKEHKSFCQGWGTREVNKCIQEKDVCHRYDFKEEKICIKWDSTKCLEWKTLTKQECEEKKKSCEKYKNVTVEYCTKEAEYCSNYQNKMCEQKEEVCVERKIEQKPVCLKRDVVKCLADGFKTKKVCEKYKPLCVEEEYRKIRYCKKQKRVCLEKGERFVGDKKCIKYGVKRIPTQKICTKYGYNYKCIKYASKKVCVERKKCKKGKLNKKGKKIGNKLKDVCVKWKKVYKRRWKAKCVEYFKKRYCASKLITKIHNFGIKYHKLAHASSRCALYKMEDTKLCKRFKLVNSKVCLRWEKAEPKCIKHKQLFKKKRYCIRYKRRKKRYCKRYASYCEEHGMKEEVHCKKYSQECVKYKEEKQKICLKKKYGCVQKGTKPEEVCARTELRCKKWSEDQLERCLKFNETCTTENIQKRIECDEYEKVCSEENPKICIKYKDGACLEYTTSAQMYCAESGKECTNYQNVNETYCKDGYVEQCTAYESKKTQGKCIQHERQCVKWIVDPDNKCVEYKPDGCAEWGTKKETACKKYEERQVCKEQVPEWKSQCITDKDICKNYRKRCVAYRGGYRECCQMKEGKKVRCWDSTGRTTFLAK